MALIYLVQSSSELQGKAGYSYGLLEGEHKRLLITFAEYSDKNRPTIFKNGDNSPKLATPPEPKGEGSGS